MGRVSRPADPSPDAPLRANVRLLGEILGRVLTEQEGEELYRLEERVRLLARLGRRGDTDPSVIDRSYDSRASSSRTSSSVVCEKSS